VFSASRTPLLCVRQQQPRTAETSVGINNRSASISKLGQMIFHFPLPFLFFNGKKLLIFKNKFGRLRGLKTKASLLLEKEQRH
jgi:hypothetical protein